MLGKTAGGLFWMFRYLERAENTARLVDAGLRIALTRSSSEEDEWASIVATSGVRDAYLDRHKAFDAERVVDFLLRERENPSSVLSAMEGARTNARLVRTALTREVWEATNEGWMTIRDRLAEPPASRDLPRILDTIRQQTALVRGTMHGTMLRNDIYDFARIGTYLERADNTARILDVKYYVLLPSAASVGSSLDNVQWETILRCVSAQRAYHWLNQGDVNPQSIADFLILDQRMPRSLAFCYDQLVDNLARLAEGYGVEYASCGVAQRTRNELKGQRIETIFEAGLHEFIERFVDQNNAVGLEIERDFRFYE